VTAGWSESSDKRRETRVSWSVVGEPGPKGDQGPAGPAGATGPQGSKGDPGPQGAKGDTGAQGPQGLRGDTGEAGQKGVDGAKGDTGASFVWRGPWDAATSYGPNDVVGYLGASWIASMATSGLAPDAASSGWSLFVPAGAQGPQGDKGDSGGEGPQGIQGIQGPQGDPGPRGFQGDPGPQGLQGLKGDKGETGGKGDTGPAEKLPDASGNVVAVAPQLTVRVPGATQDGTLVIQNSGEVGIGTNDPKAPLDVANGDVYVSKVGADIVFRTPDGARCERIALDTAGALTTQEVTCP
jgi:hypothetical protein